MNGDTIVYFHPDHTSEYVAAFDDNWFRWPAEAHGWTQRRRIPAPDVAELVGLPPLNARVALQLSGVDR